MIFIISDFPIYAETYLGYSKSPKFRKWISDLSPKESKRIEAGSKSVEGLVKSLFMVLFKQDLEQQPEEICATANQLEGRQLCDPAKLRAIQCMYSTLCVIRISLTCLLQCTSAENILYPYLEPRKRVLDGIASVRS